MNSVKKIASVSVVIALSQLLALLSVPLITRLYSPEAFGYFASMLSVAYIVGSLASFRFDKMVIVEKDDTRKLAAFFCATFSIFMVSTVVLAVGLGLYHLLNYFDATIVLLVFGSILTYSLFQLLSNSYVSYGKPFISSFMKLGQVTLFIVLQLVFPLVLSPSDITLALAFSLSNLIIVLISLVGLRDRYKKVQVEHIADYFKETVNQSTKGALSNLFNTASVQFVPILITSLFSPVLAGYYALAHRLMAAPMSLVSQSMNQVLAPKIRDSLSSNGQEMYRNVRVITLISITMFAFILLALLILGENGFSIIFGEEWANSYIYCILISIWMFSSSLSSPFSYVSIILKKEGFNLLFQFSMLTLRVLAVWVGSIFGGLYLSIVMLVSVSVILNLSYFIISIKFAGLNLKEIFYVQ
ncbi:lipopolysaccharide biosynthesis protein [Vibrio diabolicus]|uniref:lipopolysaccharide biosynthesis protein n=1 Tax=Vibrio diabolicus TaxID=50719 RepID=UPI00215EC5D3|nr:oligosaccharide flippase family protein [Vibrio diabolicus]MCS0404233.1 oligosaccharide flippase family protein [Vibrio diabolicus]